MTNYQRPISRRSVLKTVGSGAVITGFGTGAALGQEQPGDGSDSAAGTADWPRPGRDIGNTRYAPEITGPESDIGVAYGVGFDVDRTYRESAAVVSDGTVYMTAGGQDQKLYAFDAQDGTREWTFEADTQTEAPPTVVDGTLYLPASSSYVYAIDSQTGDELWRTETRHSSDQQSAPIVADGSLYFTCKGGTYALAADTGEVEWSQTSPSDSGSRVSSYFSPALRGNLLYVSGRRRRRVDGDYNETYGVFALSTADGTVQWSVETATGERINNNSQPVIADDTLYIGGNYDTETQTGGNLYALNPDSGETVWRYDSPSDEMISAPAVSDSIAVVYLGTSGIAAVDVTDGSELWLAASQSGRWDTGLPTPAIAGETVYVQAGEFQALDLSSGEQRWTLPNLEVNIARPSIDGGTVYLGSIGQDASVVNDENVVTESVTVSPARLYALESGGQDVPSIEIQRPSALSSGSSATFSASLPERFDPAEWAFTWGIADGDTVEEYEGQQVTHQYANTGEFEVAVGVSNSAGVGTSEWTRVTVGDAPGSAPLESQSGEGSGTEGQGQSNVAVFEQFGDDNSLPIAVIGAGVAGGLGIGTYRLINRKKDDERE